MSKFDFNKHLCEEPCEPLLTCECVEYVGKDLKNIGVKEGDRLCEILTRIDKTFGDILSRLRDADFSSNLSCEKLEE